MRNLGYFALVLSVLYMLACSGGGGGGKSSDTTSAATTNTGMGVIGQPVMFNGLSSDVINGRIYNRGFQIVRAQGTEKIQEDCNKTLNDRKPTFRFTITGLPTQASQQQPVPQQPQYPQYQQQQQYMPQANNHGRALGMEFVFDNAGTLMVRLTNKAGQQVSDPIYPVSGQASQNTYTLDDSQQALVVGSFRVNGTPDAGYDRENLGKRGLFPKYNPNLNYGQNNFDVGQSGFKSSYQAGQNPLSQPTVTTPTAVQNGGGASISAMFDPITARIQVACSSHDSRECVNPQHIVRMWADSITFHFGIEVADPAAGANSCWTATDAEAHEVEIK